MSGEVEIKQFQPADQDALLSFLRGSYPDERSKSDPSFWKWHFLENPNATADSIPLWIVKTGEQVVGQMATIPVRLKVGGKEKPALWIIDFILAPEYRGRGLGKGLMKAARETYCTTMIALGYNAQSEAVLLSHKWVSLGNINRYHALFFPGNANRDLSRLGGVKQLANLLYAPFRPAKSRLESNGSGSLREIREFDSSFDRLWEDASTRWPCAVVRDSRFLQWQFMKQPGKRFEVLGYYEDNQLLGYVVLYFRKPGAGVASDKVAISDICYSATNSAQIIDSLLKGALRLAIARRAGGMVIDILDSLVEERLRQFRFWRIKASPPFMAGTFEDQELMYTRQNWFLSRADSDVSIFERPNS